MPTLFGVNVPVPAITNVFPLDPDFGYKKTRSWDVIEHKFSPVLSQFFVTGGRPKIEWEIGFAAMRGTYSQLSTKFYILWQFYNARKLDGQPFYFYDPARWIDTAAVYQESPAARMTSPGTDPVTDPPPTQGRYICVFKDDILSSSLFDTQLRSTTLVLVGYDPAISVTPVSS